MDPARISLTRWLLDSDEPWTRYRTQLDLLGARDDEPAVQAARAAMLEHPLVRQLVDKVGTWPGPPLKRHNDAGHPLHALATLADFGLRAGDPGVDAAIDRVMAHQSDEGAFETVVHVPRPFGGSGRDEWSWMICDAPVLLYAVLALGPGEEDPRVARAIDHLLSLCHDDGWRCAAAKKQGRFRGPGRRSDPCPMANVYALKALSLVRDRDVSGAVNVGAEVLLRHWGGEIDRKLRLFGVGTDFRKLKYPLVWYDALHVADVLGRFDSLRRDERLRDLVGGIVQEQDQAGRYTAASMYRAWKGWSFADKKQPSPWLSFMVARLSRRVVLPLGL